MISGRWKTGPTEEEILNWFAGQYGVKKEHMSSATYHVDENGRRFRVINPEVVPTPHAKPRRAVLVENSFTKPRSFSVRMPNGLYLAQDDGSDYVLVETVRHHIAQTEQYFDKVHANFRRFWP